MASILSKWRVCITSRTTWHWLFFFTAVAVSLGLSYPSVYHNPNARDASIPLSEFSGQRALNLMTHLSSERFLATPALNVTKSWLLSELDNIRAGASGGVEMEVLVTYMSTGMSPDTSSDKTVPDLKAQGMYIGASLPIITVRISDNTANCKSRAVLVDAHFDSQFATTGASDNGAAVAVSLELIQNYMALSSYPNKYSIIFLLNSGEEEFLFGAAAFIHENHPWQSTVKVAIDLEAAGTASTPDILVRAGEHDTWLTRKLLSLPSPKLFGLAQDIFGSGLIPSGTDVSVYAAAGIPALDFVYMIDAALYHTPLDNLAHVEAGALQHRGDNLRALLPSIVDSHEFESLPSREAYLKQGRSDRPIFYSSIGNIPMSYLSQTANILCGLLITLTAVAGTVAYLLRNPDTRSLSSFFTRVLALLLSFGFVFLSLIGSLVLVLVIQSLIYAANPMAFFANRVVFAVLHGLCVVVAIICVQMAYSRVVRITPMLHSHIQTPSDLQWMVLKGTIFFMLFFNALCRMANLTTSEYFFWAAFLGLLALGTNELHPILDPHIPASIAPYARFGLRSLFPALLVCLFPFIWIIQVLLLCYAVMGDIAGRLGSPEVAVIHPDIFFAVGCSFFQFLAFCLPACFLHGGNDEERFNCDCPMRRSKSSVELKTLKQEDSSQDDGTMVSIDLLNSASEEPVNTQSVQKATIHTQPLYGTRYKHLHLHTGFLLTPLLIILFIAGCAVPCFSANKPTRVTMSHISTVDSSYIAMSYPHSGNMDNLKAHLQNAGHNIKDCNTAYGMNWKAIPGICLDSVSQPPGQAPQIVIQNNTYNATSDSRIVEFLLTDLNLPRFSFFFDAPTVIQSTFPDYTFYHRTQANWLDERGHHVKYAGADLISDYTFQVEVAGNEPFNAQLYSDNVPSSLYLDVLSDFPDWATVWGKYNIFMQSLWRTNVTIVPAA